MGEMPTLRQKSRLYEIANEIERLTNTCNGQLKNLYQVGEIIAMNIRGLVSTSTKRQAGEIISTWHNLSKREFINAMCKYFSNKPSDHKGPIAKE